MEEIIKYLEEIKEHQMQTVQLARSTEVYKLADKALTQALSLYSVSSSLSVIITPNVYNTNGYVIKKDELKEWEKDGSINKGDRVFEVISEKLY